MNEQKIWDATSIKWAQTCLRYYQYVAIEGWEPKTKSPHLKFGQVYAGALERFFIYTVKENLPYELALVQVVRYCLMETWDRETGKPWESLHNIKTRESLLRSVVWYLEHYRENPMKVITLSDGSPAVELAVRMELAHYTMMGHLDQIVEFGEQLLIRDQKTTGSALSMQYFDGWNPETQMTMYNAFGQIVFGLPIQGVVIDAAQVLVGSTRFGRGVTYRTREQVSEFLTELVPFLDSVNDYRAHEVFPMNPNACGNYAGCAFRKVCAQSPSARPAFLKADFQQTYKWDPVKKDG